jgi:hypothetical protein
MSPQKDETPAVGGPRFQSAMRTTSSLDCARRQAAVHAIRHTVRHEAFDTRDPRRVRAVAGEAGAKHRPAAASQRVAKAPTRRREA